MVLFTKELLQDVRKAMELEIDTNKYRLLSNLALYLTTLERLGIVKVETKNNG